MLTEWATRVRGLDRFALCREPAREIPVDKIMGMDFKGLSMECRFHRRG